MTIYIVIKSEIDMEGVANQTVLKAFSDRLDAEMLCREYNVKYDHHYSQASFFITETELIE